jgi:hypothetical protein
LRQVPGLVEHDEPRAGYGLGERLPVLRRVDAVGGAPHHQHRDVHRAELAEQRRVGHALHGVGLQRGPVARDCRLRLLRQRGDIDAELVRLVVGHLGDLVRREREEIGGRVAVDLQPARVDQDDAADPRAGVDGHLGRDPPADRVANDGHPGQVQLVEQMGIGEREPAHAVQVLRPCRAAEPGVHRHDHPRARRRQHLAEPGHRGRPGPAMQQQERSPRAVLGHVDPHRPQPARLNGVRRHPD